MLNQSHPVITLWRNEWELAKGDAAKAEVVKRMRAGRKKVGLRNLPPLNPTQEAYWRDPQPFEPLISSVPKAPKQTERVRRAQELHAEGKSFQQIADELASRSRRPGSGSGGRRPASGNASSPPKDSAP